MIDGRLSSRKNCELSSPGPNLLDKYLAVWKTSRLPLAACILWTTVGGGYRVVNPFSSSADVSPNNKELSLRATFTSLVSGATNHLFVVVSLHCCVFLRQVLFCGDLTATSESAFAKQATRGFRKMGTPTHRFVSHFTFSTTVVGRSNASWRLGTRSLSRSGAR